MDITLNSTEVRVLGALIEKQVTTPDYYPLTLNALMNACNQLTNREPVVSYDEKTVARALDSLRTKQLTRTIISTENRVPKYEQAFTELFNLSEAETAALCILMLRGPQTAGEIRSRSGRLYDFKTLNDVQNTLQRLIERKPQPLVAILPRQPGTKESRYAQLLAGPVEAEERAPVVRLEPASVEVQAENDRIARLEQEVSLLKNELEELKRQFAAFRKQFE